MSLVLLNLQSNQQIKLDDQNPFVIGRGNVAGCFDKRVSRNHGRITRTLDGKIRLLALHCNPCFFTRNGVPPVLQLNKDEEEILKEGDCLGLLPNAFWFQITTLKEEIKKEIKVEQGDRCSKTEKSDNPIEISENRIVIKQEAAENDSQPEKVALDNVTNDKNRDSTTSMSVPSVSTETVSNGGSNSRRLGDPEFEKTRRLPLSMYEIDEPIQRNKSVSKHKLTSDRSPKNKKPKLASDIKDEPKNSDEIVDVSIASTSKSSNQSDSDVQIIGESSKITSHKEAYESDVNDCVESPRKRNICQYEGRCYRKNPQHKLDYCHPGDADYIPYEERPLCPFGSACYRKNEAHKVDFRHPAASSSKKASSPLPAKRKRKKVQNSDYEDDDDYDLEDPFINDASSDEYVPSGSEEEELEDFSSSREGD